MKAQFLRRFDVTRNIKKPEKAYERKKRWEENAAGFDILHRNILNFFLLTLGPEKMPTPKNI